MVLNNSAFRCWRVLDHHQQLHRLQWGMIIVLLLGCCGLGWGWSQAPQHLTVYMPPDLSEGVTQAAGHIPKPLLHSFALHVWQRLYDWPTAKLDQRGHSCYQQAIQTYWAYLTPQFRRYLRQEAQQLQQAGKLNRTRHLALTALSLYQLGTVKKLASGVWQVMLTVHLVEQENGMVVKDHTIRYPLRVVRSSLDTQNNPYGLALDGFTAPPERLKTIPVSTAQPPSSFPWESH